MKGEKEGAPARVGQMMYYVKEQKITFGQIHIVLIAMFLVGCNRQAAFTCNKMHYACVLAMTNKGQGMCACSQEWMTCMTAAGGGH